MENQVQLKLQFKYKKYEIPIIFKGLFDVDKNISMQLLYNPSHEYKVTSNVSEEIFLSFISYWIEGKTPTITFENHYEYHQLSQEFGIMNDILDQARKDFDECEQNLYILNYSKGHDTTAIEKEVSAHLDEYITKHGKELMNLEIQKLFNIFNSDELNLTKQDEAYQLIKNHYENHKNDEIFILLCSLEGKKLNRANFRESILEAKKRCGFLPAIEMSFFDLIKNDVSTMREDNSKQASRIDKLEEIITKQKGQIKEQSKLINENKEQYKRIDKLENIINNQKEQIKEQSKLINENKEQYKRLDKLEEMVREQANQIQNQENQIKKLTQEIQELKKSDQEKQKQIDAIKQKQNKQVNENFTEINEKLKKQDKELNEMHKTLEMKIKTQDEIIQCQFEGNNSGIISYLTKKNATVSITGGGSQSPSYPITNIIRDDSSYYYNYFRNSSNLTEKDGYIQFDFGKKRINLAAYLLRSEYGTIYPKTWEILGSNNGNDWKVLNRQENDSYLKEGTKQHVYVCQKTDDYYQYIKINQKESWSSNKFALCFGYIEFFGSILN